MSVTDYLSQGAFIGFGKETTPDTPVTSSFYVPFSAPKWNPNLKWQTDESMVGSATVTRDLVPLVRYDELSFKHYLYLDSIGMQLVAILGGTDNVTGTGPYVHTVKLLNSPSTGYQAPTYTLDYFDSSQTRQIAASKLSKLELAWTADGTVEVTDTWMGFPENDISKPSPTASTASLVPGWGLAVTIGGTASNIMLSGSLTIDRGAEAIFVSSGLQSPHQIFQGPLTAKGKMKFLVEPGSINFFGNTGMTHDQQAVVLTFTDPVSGDILTFTTTKAQFNKPQLDPGKKYLAVDCEFTATDNTTDASTGVSPIQAALTNTQSTAY